MMATVQVPLGGLLFYVWMTSTKRGIVLVDEIQNLEIMYEITIFLYCEKNKEIA